MSSPRSGRVATLVIGATAAAVAAGACSSAQPASRDASAARVAALAAAVDIRAIGCQPAAYRGAGAMIDDGPIDDGPIDDGPIDGGPIDSGSIDGGSLDGGLILTAAHVVSGADAITVRSAAEGEPDSIAHLLAVDPVNDLALLGVAPGELPDRSPLPLGVAAAAEAEGATVLFRDDQPVVTELTITKQIVVRILDIHHEAMVDRPGYEVGISITAGDSGAVMVDASGTAIGVLYAKSHTDAGRAFATDPSALPALTTAAASVDPTVGIDTGDCV